jgi:hypothetical protein
MTEGREVESLSDALWMIREREKINATGEPHRERLRGWGTKA